MAVQIQLRNDTAANWTSNNPVLAQGEMGLETDTRYFKMGNGTTAWNSLSYVSVAGPIPISSVTGLQAALDAKAPATAAVSDISAAYTLVAGDKNKLIRSTNAAITVTVPDVLANGDRVDFIQVGAGQITFAGSGVTLNSADAQLKTAKQFAAASILKAGGAYYLVGNLG